MNHAAGYLCRVAILNPFQESYLLGERIISFDRHQRTGRGGWGGCSPPSRQKNSIIRAKVVYRSGKETVKKYILLFNISIHLFSSRNSPNLLNYLGPTSRDGLLGVRTLSSAEGLGMIIKTALGLELRMISLAAMLIYVSSRVHVYLVDSSMSVEVS